MRVSSKEIAMPPFADSYQVGEIARTTLKVRSPNEPTSHFALSYQIPEGTGRFLIDGISLLPGQTLPFLQGSTERTASLTYEQDEPGPVRIVLTLTDTYGYVTQSELSTLYEQNRISRTVHFWVEYENLDDGKIKVRANCDDYDLPDQVTLEASFKVHYIPRGSAPSLTTTRRATFVLTDAQPFDEKTLTMEANSTYSGIKILGYNNVSIVSLTPSQSADGLVNYVCSNETETEK